jgi:hypothetical protein
MKPHAIAAVLASSLALTLAAQAQQPTSDGPRYQSENLVRPTDYATWTFLGSMIGMTYGAPANPPQFGSVYVNPSSYRSFMQTGKWPNGTILILETRNSGTEGPGRFQDTLAGIEAHVKDLRFPDGWAFFNFGGPPTLKESTARLSANVGGCVECHTKNAAVERTFVQFYPAALEIARQKGTLNAGHK